MTEGLISLGRNSESDMDDMNLYLEFVFGGSKDNMRGFLIVSPGFVGQLLCVSDSKIV